MLKMQQAIDFVGRGREQWGKGAFLGDSVLFCENHAGFLTSKLIALRLLSVVNIFEYPRSGRLCVELCSDTEEN